MSSTHFFGTHIKLYLMHSCLYMNILYIKLYIYKLFDNNPIVDDTIQNKFKSNSFSNNQEMF